MAKVTIPSWVGQYFPDKVLQWLQEYIVSTINSQGDGIDYLNTSKASKAYGTEDNVALMGTDGTFKDSGSSYADLQELIGLQFGDVPNGNYSAFDQTTGLLQFYGDARPEVDQLGQIAGSRLESPSSNLTFDAAENAYVFNDVCTLADRAGQSLQLNHGYDVTETVVPHIHWTQTLGTVIPNFLLGYRWQIPGEPVVTTWEYEPFEDQVFLYDGSGGMNQITYFPALQPPETAAASTILQMRLFRDTGNDSGLFASSDNVSGSVYVLAWDVNVRVNAIGSLYEEE